MPREIERINEKRSFRRGRGGGFSASISSTVTNWGDEAGKPFINERERTKKANTKNHFKG